MTESDRAAGGPAPDAQATSAAAATAASTAARDVPHQPWEGTSLQQLRSVLQQFAAERDWGQYHTPRNLVLALVGEAGELAECFQWKGEVPCGLPGFSNAERQHVGEELADVLLYLVRLSDACGIDLAAAAEAKLRKNAAKYPAEQCRGSSAKYTAYEQEQQEQQQQPGQVNGSLEQQTCGAEEQQQQQQQASCWQT